MTEAAAFSRTARKPTFFALMPVNAAPSELTKLKPGSGTGPRQTRMEMHLF